MAFMDYLASYPGVSSLAIFLFIVLGYTIYTLFLHPLASVPGHPLAKISSLWLYYHTYVGDEATAIHDLHKKYNSALLRVAPNHVDISDPDAISPIYEKGGGFPKSPCYANFDIDAHKTIFSTTDNTYRTPRAKAVVPLFSTASIRGNSALLYHSIDGMVTRLQSDAATGRPVNILNLTRSLAVDIVSTHLFDTNYNGTGEKTNRLSVSAFVDAFVAVGRFFYCPNWVFGWLEWCADKLFQDLNTYSSMEVVDKFVEDLVSRTSPGDTNYPGRLMGLGLQKSEVVSQCKDLIFAGTDSTGMNLASIFRYLAVHQDRLERLQNELLANKSSSMPVEIQALPYLTAVVKEGLRLSMANPSRLPHRVPSPGWAFKGTFFPPGTDVGISAFEMHMNPVSFPDSGVFNPERWLVDDAAAKERMNKSFFAFGAGIRSCIAKNLAMTELYMGTERVVESRVLRGAKACQERVEIYEWFNSSVKGEKIELIWPMSRT